jgi:hypothetical protein
MEIPGNRPMEGRMSANESTFAYIPGLAARNLACAVIKQALVDALDPTTPPDVRADAQAFLSGDEWYRMWCTAGGYTSRPLLHRQEAA